MCKVLLELLGLLFRMLASKHLVMEFRTFPRFPLLRMIVVDVLVVGSIVV